MASTIWRGFITFGLVSVPVRLFRAARAERVSLRRLYRADAAGQEDDFAVAERAGEVAKSKGLPNMQVALAWILSKPVVSAPIIGASKPHHLNDALAALNVKLTPEEIGRLEEPYKPHKISGHS